MFQATTHRKRRDATAKKTGEIYCTASGKFFYVCTYCDVEWSTCYSLTKHIKSHFVKEEPCSEVRLAEPEFVTVNEPILMSEIKTEIKSNDKRIDADRSIPMDKSNSLEVESNKIENRVHSIVTPESPPPAKVVKVVKLKRIKPNARLVAMKKKTLLEAASPKNSVNLKIQSNVRNIEPAQSEITAKTVHVESNTNRKSSKDPDIFLCVLCGSIQKTKGRLSEHMLLHEDRKIECEDCGKRFRRFSSLRRHYWLHEKPSFVCNVCSKPFKMQRYLDRHMAVHDEPKFPCRHCSSEFKFASVRRIHERNRHFVV